jgi:hypothetical protein
VVDLLLLLLFFFFFFSQITLFLDILMKEILSPESQSPNGVRTHLIDVYLEELTTVGGAEVRSSAVRPTQQRAGTAMPGVAMGTIRNSSLLGLLPSWDPVSDS